MKIFRIEAEDGKGPYTSKHYWKNWEKYHSGWKFPDSYPTPHKEGIIEVSYQWHSGFISAEQLLDWFTRDQLLEIENTYPGFRISIYSVKAKFRNCSKKQAIFCKEEAKIVKTYTIKQFLKANSCL